MRKFLAMAGLIAVAATACNKINNESASVMPKGEETILTVKVAGSNLTKATEAGIANEDKVRSIDVFVFFNGGDYDGQLDAYKHFAQETLTGTLKATTGARYIYAVVNSEFAESELETIATLAQFNAKVATLASQKTAGTPDVLDNFTMIGSTSQTLVAGDNAVTVNVDRIASRVRVKKITRNFDSPALQAKTFTVTDMYLSNAVIKDEYDLVYTPVVADFVNQNGTYTALDASKDLWLHRTFTQAIVDEHTTANSSWDCSAPANYLYTFPNAYANEIDGSAEFAVQCTKLVVKASLEGDSKPMYYVIPLPELKANYTYDIEELIITRRGSSDPNQKTQVANVNYTISINPWTIQLIGTETGTGKYII